MTNEQKLKMLNDFLTADQIENREENGRLLRYVDGHQVIHQLNQIFGNTNWSYNIKELSKISENTGKTKTGKDAYFVGYLCQVNLIVPNLVSGGTITINDVGFGSGIDSNLGKSHESATKEAVTDAIKRCAKSLGNSLGLCLYDKTFKAQKAIQQKNEMDKNVHLDLKDDVEPNKVVVWSSKPSQKQIDFLKKNNIKFENNITGQQASELIKRFINK